MRKEAMQVEGMTSVLNSGDLCYVLESNADIRDQSTSNNKLNETNYEPELRKKRQILPTRVNGYSKIRPADSDIRVQEIFDVNGKGKKVEKHIRGAGGEGGKSGKWNNRAFIN